MEKKVNEFRQDIDILRGLAVILVVLYHLDIVLFRSGFIGVDIFFVISGYLIAQIYSENVSVLEFYERRMRRILPAMLAVLLIFFLIAPLLFLPFEVRKISDTVIGTLLFSPNLVFWRDNDYFAALDFSPMLHYWSLGVELQYYLLIPLLLKICNRKHIGMFAIGVVSLLLCLYVSSVSAKTAFFFLPTRVWEFLVGYAAFYVGQRQLLARFDQSRVKIGFALLCLFALILCATLTIPVAAYPGVYALVPVGLSFLYMFLGVPNHFVGASAFLGVIRYLAKISFSIYLVHFPVIFIFKYLPFSEVKAITLSGQLWSLAITLGLAVLSFRYIEQPFRNAHVMSTRKFVIAMFLLCGLLLSALAIFHVKGFFSNYYSEPEQKIIKAMTDRGAWRCSKLEKLLEFKAESCFILKNEAPRKTVYLVGDSHIDALKEIFVELAKERNYSVRLNKQRCLLGQYQCSSQSIIAEIEKYQITDVVLHGYNYALFDYSDLQKLIAWSQDRGVNIHIVGPIPTYDKPIPLTLYKEHHQRATLLDRLDLAGFQASIPQEYLSFRGLEAGKEKVFFYSPEIQLCAPGCVLDGADGVYYFDSNHLTLTGERLLAPMVKEIYGK